MICTIPEGSTLKHPVYECCDQTFSQAPQAAYHLWRQHEKLFKAADDAVRHLWADFNARAAKDAMDKEMEGRHHAQRLVLWSHHRLCGGAVSGGDGDGLGRACAGLGVWRKLG